MSLAVIGDIHGDAKKLEALLPFLIRCGRTTVFVGDYINRGPESKRVIELLVGVAPLINAVFLWGNHEIALLRYLKHGNFEAFARHGGLDTLRSYLGSNVTEVYKEFLNAFPRSHYHFLTLLRRYYETDAVLISHMGCSPDAPKSRSYRNLVLEPHRLLFERETNLQKLVVCGHYRQKECRPFNGKSVICLDTGSGSNGPLTCLLLPEREFIFS